MWPTDNTILYLFAGLVPLTLSFLTGFKAGWQGLLSLRFIGILFMWIGYHLSPWLSFFGGKYWDHFLLVPCHIDRGLLFTAFCMLSYWYGFGLFGKKKNLRVKNFQFKPLISRIYLPWVCIVVLTSIFFLLFVVKVGGLAELMASSTPRGAGQFNSVDSLGTLSRMIDVIFMPFGLALGVFSSLFIVKNKHSPPKVFIGLISLAISGIHYIHVFSRGAGLCFFILAFVSLFAHGKKGVVLAAIAFVFAYNMGVVGLDFRGQYFPGVNNYLDASIEYVFKDQRSDSVDGNFKNSLDAMAPWTRKIESGHENIPSLKYTMLLIWNQQPLPSVFVSMLPVGPSLSIVMGTYGRTGITTPALAEIFYAMGWWGCILVYVLGAIYGKFESFLYTHISLVTFLGLLLCCVSFPIGLHSSLRAMTRPLLYSYVLYGAVAVLNKRKVPYNIRGPFKVDMV